MRIAFITRAKNPTNGVRVYGSVRSRSVSGLLHDVVYTRNKNTRRWLCSCHDFLFRQFPKNRNCDHIREVRKRFGRFGTKVPLT